MQASHAPSNFNKQEATAMQSITSKKETTRSLQPLFVVLVLAVLLGLVALLFGVSPETVGLGFVDILIFSLIGMAMLRGLEPAPANKLHRHTAGH
jgi:uncharacterized transporter YbjL